MSLGNTLSYNIERAYRGFCAKTKSFKDDVFVISYPKSGRTWLRLLIAKFLVEQYSLSSNFMLDTRYVCWKAKVPSICFRHADSFIINVETDLDKEFYVKDVFQNKKIVFLTRDISDILVSLYYHYRYREKKYNGNISDFIRHGGFGIARIVRFYNVWFGYMRGRDDVIKINYEDLHSDTAEILKKVLRFSGIKTLDDEFVRRSVKYCAFEKMRKMEKRKEHKSEVLSWTGDDDRGRKVRKGRPGESRKELGSEDMDFVNSFTSKNLMEL